MRLNDYRNVLGLALMLFCVLCTGLSVEAGTVYNSPYVDFAPDGKAWTTDLGDVDYEWYPVGEEICTNIPSTLKPLGTGQHYFKQPRTGTIPVGRWEVVYRTGTCIHNSYPPKGISWHGINFGRKYCGNYYYSGWNPYCADCGEKITGMLFYMSYEAAESLDYLEIGTGMDYYYLCPWCNNLEMGSPISSHNCSGISWNRYKIRYHPNTIGLYTGYMEDSIHFYNNATVYENETVSPQKKLSPNSYIRKGYVFAGWNTMPDGSGTFYADGAEIYNLTSENYEPGTERGVITLYAMWKPATGTLCIDPAGGEYEGEKSITVIQGDYLDRYVVKEPTAPKGNTVRFDTGGGEAIESLTGRQYFLEWIQAEEFKGRFEESDYEEDVYVFTAPDGHEDVLIACYEKMAIQLPLPKREGYSFGGWYYDTTFKRPAGNAGEEFVPNKDVTLYAQWVELKLTATDNYTANDQKGAVDLSWEQPDGQEKQYLVYQSRDAANWKLITGSEEIGIVSPVKLTVPYTQSTSEYRVPYSGFYQLTVLGAQGENYASFKGGAGGRVYARTWLDRGETLKFTTGGQGGYNGGGNGTVYGNGGGYTSVESDRKGCFLIAGGGGGASESGNGGAGGLASNLTTGRNGENGMAGGGGGHRGGKAGEYIRHYHTEACYREVTTNVLTDYNHYKETSQVIYATEEDEDGDDTDYMYQITQYGNIGKIIPVKPGNKVQLEIFQAMIYPLGDNDENNSFIEVYNQNGECIFRKYGGIHSEYYVYHSDSYGWEDDEYVATGSWWRAGKMGEEKPSYWVEYAGEDDGYEVLETSGNIPEYIDPENEKDIDVIAKWLGGTTHYSNGNSFFGDCGTIFIEEMVIPEGTTGIYLKSSIDSNYDAHGIRQNIFRVAAISGKELVCGFEEGEIVSSKPAYGGSNYINGDFCTYMENQPGMNTGNGRVTLVSEQIGFLSENDIKGVVANDLNAPDTIEEASVQRTLKGTNKILVQWQAPRDNGTEYFHKVESYQKNGICCSNITSNVLTTGIAGYFWVRNEDSQTKVTKSGYFCESEEMVLSLAEEEMWLHIAPVDKAGNLGETIHINLNPFAWNVKWPLHTIPLQLVLSEGVHRSDDGSRYYVKCDGETPFTMQYGAWMEGKPYDGYRINHAVFAIMNESKEVVAENTIFLDEQDEVTYSASKQGPLLFGTYQEVRRMQDERYLQIAQQFVLDKKANGEVLHVVPRAAADSKNILTYSDYEEDVQHGLYLIGDGEAPMISGLEKMEQRNRIDRGKESVVIEVKAEDALSGVAEFYVEVENHDNRITRKFVTDETAEISLNLTETDPVFSGDFTVTAVAKDCVGNVREISCDTMGFSLEAEITRILSPHEPVFRKGESGILTIHVWGYPDKVEVTFPQEITNGDSQWNHTFDYTDVPQYEREEKIQFMIPLEMDDAQELEVIVRAYKGERKLEEHPALAILGVRGSILEDIRTRLR